MNALEAAVLLQREAAATSWTNRDVYEHGFISDDAEHGAQRYAAALYAAAREAYWFATSVVFAPPDGFGNVQ